MTAGGLQGATELLVQSSLPLAFAAVGLIILLLRPEDRNVWLLASFFAGIIAVSGFPSGFETVPDTLRPWMEVYKGFFWGMIGASFYFLCAVFPARSPLDRRLPWLKWVGVVLGLGLVGEMQYPDVGPIVRTYSRILPRNVNMPVTFGIGLTFLVFGLVSLAANFFFAREPESRRKIRVIFWGTVVGFGPSLIRAAAQRYTSFHSPAWLEILLNATLLLVPASFAYAVFKQRVLDIPVLLQRSARYVLVQRGFLLLLCFFSVGLTLVFATSVAHLPLAVDMGQSANTALGALFGTALLWGGSQVHTRVSRRIDSAFFRNAYDARVILENLAATSRTAANRDVLASLLLNQLNAALQPASLVVYLATTDDELGAAAGVVPSQLQTISCSSPLLVELARQGEPWELPPAGLDADPRTAVLAQLHSGCLVPVPGRDGQLVGLLALGPRLSEEPYSGEDKRLLASVASQVGMALENFRLAENIAEKLETERRAAREMEIARDVQTRLLPQARAGAADARMRGSMSPGPARRWRLLRLPRIGPGPGRAGAGRCLRQRRPRRAVDGQSAGPFAQSQWTHARRNGADDAARSRQNPAAGEPDCVKSTAAQHYATLFFGLYDDRPRCLNYVNCGHNPPMLLRRRRRRGPVEVHGHGHRAVREVGVCRARDSAPSRRSPGGLQRRRHRSYARRGEFGEPRFLDDLRQTCRLPVEQIVQHHLHRGTAVQRRKSVGRPTLVVARAR